MLEVLKHQGTMCMAANLGLFPGVSTATATFQIDGRPCPQTPSARLTGPPQAAPGLLESGPGALLPTVFADEPHKAAAAMVFKLQAVCSFANDG
jgi:hypothetical protein